MCSAQAHVRFVPIADIACCRFVAATLNTTIEYRDLIPGLFRPRARIHVVPDLLPTS
jgi:hypothetical protein